MGQEEAGKPVGRLSQGSGPEAVVLRAEGSCGRTCSCADYVGNPVPVPGLYIHKLFLLQKAFGIQMANIFLEGKKKSLMQP